MDLERVTTSQAFTVTHTEYDLATDYMFRRIGRSRLTTRSFIKRAVLFALGIALLGSPYTIVIGILFLVMLALVWSFPLWGGLLQRGTFQSAPRIPQTYEVTERGFAVRSPGKDATAEWNKLSYWEENEGVLRLSACDMPSVYLPIDRLRSAGVYDAVMALCRSHGKQFTAAGA